MAWGTGLGIVVGLFAPPMVTSVVVGAAGGTVAGKFAPHRLKSGHRRLGRRGTTRRDLKSSLAMATGKFNPDGTKLPIPDRTFGGTAGRQSGADQRQNARKKGPRALPCPSPVVGPSEVDKEPNHPLMCNWASGPG